jgi:hypothetical protein
MDDWRGTSMKTYRIAAELPVTRPGADAETAQDVVPGAQVSDHGCRLAAGVQVSDGRRVGPYEWLCEPSVRTRGEARRNSLTAAFSIYPREHPSVEARW